ncbi:MAG TPA: response regulator [Proteobacteria bacterium]|nr:response regulator [Pseudomonadota bacterium]
MNDLDGKYKILIADDDPTSLAILAAMLEKAGYDILIAVDGGQAF